MYPCIVGNALILIRLIPPFQDHFLKSRSKVKILTRCIPGCLKEIILMSNDNFRTIRPNFLKLSH